MNKYVVRRDVLLFAIYSFVFFIPNYFAGTFTSIASNIAMIIAGIFILSKKIKPSSLVSTIIVYFLFLIGITFIMKSNTVNIHTLATPIKTILYLMVLHYMFVKKKESCINALLFSITFYVLMNSILIILYPNGLYQVISEINEWSSVASANWLFGNKNNQILWYVLWILLLSIKLDITNNKIRWKRILFISIIVSGIIFMIIQSSTSLIVLVVLIFGVYVGNYNKILSKIRIKATFFLVLFGLIESLLALGYTTYFNSVIGQFFGKNTTFSNRVIIWQTVLSRIIQKPIFGWGIISSGEAGDILGRVTYVNAHNQALNVLWQGGVVLFVVFIVLLIKVSKNIDSIPKPKVHIKSVFIFAALLIEMLMEVIMGMGAFWIILMLLYLISEEEKITAYGECK